MNLSKRIIIFGFAYLILGGILMITNAASNTRPPNFAVRLSYGVYIGPLIIVLGLIIHPWDK